MGQLIHYNEHGITKGIPKATVDHFYEEAAQYNFANPGFCDHAGGFTHIVWVNTEYVGMAVSDDNKYVVTNFLPAGNLNDPDHFERNVHPFGTSMGERDPLPLIGEVTGERWDANFQRALSRCPIKGVKESIMEDMDQGKRVVLRRKARSIELITYCKDGIKE